MGATPESMALSRAEMELKAREDAAAHARLFGQERPLLYFAEAANKELLDLREALRKKEEEEGSAAYQLKIDLASAQQNETRLKDEVEQLRQRLAQSESEVVHVSDAMTSASIQAQNTAEELKLAQAALENEKEKQAREIQELKACTANAVQDATAAQLAKEDADRKLGTILAGSDAKENELESALFNSVHECAQLRKDHQDAIDEMAITMGRQKQDYEHSLTEAQAAFEAESNNQKLEIEHQKTKIEQLESQVSSFTSMHTKDMAKASEEHHKLAMSLTETREGLGQMTATHQSTTIALQNLQLESRMQQREAESALREAAIERKNLEDLLSQEQTRLQHQQNLAETKEKFLKEQYEHKIALLQQEHATEIEMLSQQNDVRFEKSEDVATAAQASIQAAA